MNSYLLFGIIGWLYAISVLKRAHLSAYYFIVGSVGLFFILIAIGNPYWVWFLTHSVINGIAWVSDLTHWSSVHTKYGIVYIVNAIRPVTMSIDYECSGIIETTAFVSLLAFYPTYGRQEKLFYLALGTLWVYLANVIRLLLVVILVHFGGANWFFTAHTIIGRLVFYCLIIMLYYNVFTYSQLSQSLYRNFKRHFSRG
ncbi:exosortase family protein XrtG [Levilactobacillus yonginensis]|uniref:exosortase family protein XrtG n=1 Tax=Levilactobacillus yonginensis TaxID=1054041 RepID=UPI000F7AFC0A|nr:exosortase family protein XrtG [Levilactobacillus yonginensis]